MTPQGGRLRRPIGAARSLGGFALALGALVLAGASDAEPRGELATCRAAGADVQALSGSRLFEAPSYRLELVPGRALGCADATVRRVLEAIEAALAGLPGARPSRPLRVHLDPRLPRRQAPLAGIEVHVSRRELLVASASVDELGPEVWQHELVHVLAAAPPDAAIEMRRLWLTLEEALTMHVVRASQASPGAATPTRPERKSAAMGRSIKKESAGGAADMSLPLGDDQAEVRWRRWRRALPALALLASPAYDPHPLAEGLARELARDGEALPDAWLACLAAPAPELPAAAAPEDVFRAFAGRCFPRAAAELTTAIERWWGAAMPERSEPASDAPALAARKAAARAEDSR